MSAFISMVAATGRKIVTVGKAYVADLRRVLADVRRNSALIEIEIHDGNYRLASKNDDDLPASR
jgi:hypothetical protein